MEEINPWFKDRDEYYKHRNMMLDHDNWPKHSPPFLCLKNPARMEEGLPTAYAVMRLISVGIVQITVQGEEPRPSVRQSPEFIDQLLAEGWVVD